MVVAVIALAVALSSIPLYRVVKQEYIPSDVDEAEFDEVDREVTEIVAAAVEFAKNGTDPRPEDALKNVYA